MRRELKATRRPSERGSVAIEAAIVIPILVIFIGLPSIILAFYCLQYTAAQKAVHDAALYLSTAPLVEVTTTGPDGNFAAITVAKKIVAKELAGTVPNGVPADPEIYCKYKFASGTPTRGCTITYTKNSSYTLYEFDVGIPITFINPITGNDTGVLIAPYAAVRYLGR
jgi:Flp pilus assembly protein TadG